MRLLFAWYWFYQSLLYKYLCSMAARKSMIIPWIEGLIQSWFPENWGGMYNLPRAVILRPFKRLSGWFKLISNAITDFSGMVAYSSHLLYILVAVSNSVPLWMLNYTRIFVLKLMNIWSAWTLLYHTSYDFVK